ncbi:MAG: chromate transporter, partial [Phycisphaerales bacterium]|nr:chromate transporter [Phycisphaerales bacterium]
MSPALRELAPVFARIGLLSFGGPAAQIALLHQTCVDQKRWLTEREFLAALNLCTLLPGPEATQLAAYVGLRRAGTPGAILAATLFLLPGALILLALSLLYQAYGSLPPVRGLILGLSAAVLGLIAQALWRIASRTLKTPAAAMLALGSLIAIAVFAIPFPIIIAAAGIFGLIFPRL